MTNTVSYNDRGYLYVSTDWHGDYKGFKNWLIRVQEHQKIEGITQASALILGDIIDPKKQEHEFNNGDLKILDELDNARANYPKLPISVLMGNHERGLVILNQMKKNKIDIQKYEQSYNSIKRLNRTHFLHFEQLPCSAVTQTGIVLTHAGLPRGGIESLFESSEENVIQMTEGCPEDFDPIKVNEKLNRLEIRYSISGHTPLNHFSPEAIREGIVTLGKNRFIFTSNEGYFPGRRVSLCLNLQKEYGDLIKELKEDQGIIYLD